jgi:hypothetical protein
MSSNFREWKNYKALGSVNNALKINWGPGQPVSKFYWLSSKADTQVLMSGGGRGELEEHWLEVTSMRPSSSWKNVNKWEPLFSLRLWETFCWIYGIIHAINELKEKFARFGGSARLGMRCTKGSQRTWCQWTRKYSLILQNKWANDLNQNYL